jgi:hypothetical protein
MIEEDRTIDETQDFVAMEAASIDQVLTVGATTISRSL